MHIIRHVIQLRLFYENDIIIRRLAGRMMQFNTSTNDGARILNIIILFVWKFRKTRLSIIFVYCYLVYRYISMTYYSSIHTSLHIAYTCYIYTFNESQLQQRECSRVEDLVLGFSPSRKTTCVWVLFETEIKRGCLYDA